MVDFTLVCKLQIVNGKDYALGLRRSDFDSEEKFQAGLKFLFESVRLSVINAQDKKPEEMKL